MPSPGTFPTPTARRFSEDGGEDAAVMTDSEETY